MLSAEQSYSRLFRPWDVSDAKEKVPDVQTKLKCDNISTNTDLASLRDKKRQTEETRRENRLRKIRGHFKRTDPSSDQDATVSTTTVDEKCEILTKESPVASLTSCCDRLLQEPENKTDVKTERRRTPETKTYTPAAIPETHFQQGLIPASFNFHPGFLPDYIPADLAQALGVPPTDPLLLESLAQGYAMEFEYARILQQENEAKLLNARKQRPKKYKCPHCQVGFSNNGQLKGHIRIHTGERPYKCDDKTCGKTFTRNEELTRHKRIHSGVRPFPCGTCGKKFGRRDHLKKHTRTHFMQADRMLPVFVPLSAVQQGFPYLYGY